MSSLGVLHYLSNSLFRLMWLLGHGEVFLFSVFEPQFSPIGNKVVPIILANEEEKTI